MKKDGTFEGRALVITGSGRGRGVGQATALLFASEGARVVAHDVDEKPAQETAKKI